MKEIELEGNETRDVNGGWRKVYWKAMKLEIWMKTEWIFWWQVNTARIGNEIIWWWMKQEIWMKDEGNWIGREWNKRCERRMKEIVLEGNETRKTRVFMKLYWGNEMLELRLRDNEIIFGVNEIYKMNEMWMKHRK